MKLEKPQFHIIANRNASSSEVDILRNVATESGMDNVSVKKTGGTTALGADGAPEVILLVKYVSVAMAGGILAAIGTDIWKNIKKFVWFTFKKYKERFNPENQWFYNPIIVVNILVNEESRIQIRFPRRDAEELQKSIESLEKIINISSGENFVSFKFDRGEWIKTQEKFKTQEELQAESFGQGLQSQIEEPTTVAELQEQIQVLLSQIESLGSQIGMPISFRHGQGAEIDLFERENDRIENYLSEFTHREGVLLTIASLLSLFPLFDIEKALPQFLLWTIPFLVVAITTYICSSKRVNIVSKININSDSGSLDSRSINKLLKERYFSVMKFHKITDAAIVSFFTSFIANYYFLAFVGVPDFVVSILIAILAILLGGVRYYYASKLKKEDALSVPGVHAVGGIPNEADIP